MRPGPLDGSRRFGAFSLDRAFDHLRRCRRTRKDAEVVSRTTWRLHVTKHVPAALFVAALFCGSGAAFAQVPGQFTGAEILPVNAHMYGGYLVASNNVVGGLAQLRLSFYPGVDFGFQGGLA